MRMILHHLRTKFVFYRPTGLHKNSIIGYGNGYLRHRLVHFAIWRIKLKKQFTTIGVDIPRTVQTVLD